MTDEETIELPKKYDIEIHCFSPLEIYHTESNSMATGFFARMIILDCEKADAKKLKKKKVQNQKS